MAKRRKKKRRRSAADLVLGAAILLLLILVGAGAAFGTDIITEYALSSGGGSAVLGAAGDAANQEAQAAVDGAAAEETQENMTEQSGGTKSGGEEGDKENTETQGAGTSADAGEETAAQSEGSDAPVLRIVIDAGHGGPGTEDATQLGAVYNNSQEKDLTLKIALALGEELSAYGNVEVYYTRTTDTAMTLKERAEYAASVDADLLVSIHLNASESHLFYGSEVWTSAFDSCYALGSGVGEKIIEELTDYGFVSKGVKTRLGSKGNDYYGVIREAYALGVPTIIVEHGYMDDDADWSLMDSDADLAALGQRDAAGIAAYFGLQKGETLSEINTDLTLPASSPVRPDGTAPTDAWYTVSYQSGGAAEITLHATENESMLMYYGYSLDGGTTFEPLYYWREGDTVSFTVKLTEAQEGRLVVRVWNNYELYVDAERR